MTNGIADATGFWAANGMCAAGPMAWRFAHQPVADVCTAERDLELQGGSMTKRSALPGRITARPDVLGGKPIIRDMRIPVELVLSLLAQGVTPKTSWTIIPTWSWKISAPA